MATNGVLRSRINKWSKAATAIVNNYSKLGNYAQHFDSIITNLEKYDSPVNVEEDIRKCTVRLFYSCKRFLYKLQNMPNQKLLRF